MYLCCHQKSFLFTSNMSCSPLTRRQQTCSTYSILFVWQSLAILFRGVYLPNTYIHCTYLFSVLNRTSSKCWMMIGGKFYPLLSLGDALQSHLIAPFLQLYVYITKLLHRNWHFSYKMSINWLYGRMVSDSTGRQHCRQDHIFPTNTDLLAHLVTPAERPRSPLYSSIIFQL